MTNRERMYSIGFINEELGECRLLIEHFFCACVGTCSADNCLSCQSIWLDREYDRELEFEEE